MKRSILLTGLIFSLELFCLSGEKFRVAKTTVAELNSPYDSQQVSVGINDAISIKIPEDLTFISGIELNIKIPEVIANYRNSVSYALYDQITPSPSSKNIDYNGNRLTYDSLPGRFSQTVCIPLSEKSNLRADSYTKVLNKVPDISQGKLFMRFQLAMKGVPDSMYNALFDVTVKPILIDRGRLNLDIQIPENILDYSYLVYIDDNLVNENSLELLSPGEHHLSIVSDNFRNEVRTFIIEQAKITSITVVMRDIAPSVRFICPDNAKVMYDGNEIEEKNREMTITTGSHTVKFLIGDYEITKTFLAENGRSYNINLVVDAQIKESE